MRFCFSHDYGSGLWNNCIQNFYLGRYIVGYTVGNLVLRRRASGAVKRDFQTDIRRYNSPIESFEYGHPHSNALLHIRRYTSPIEKFEYGYPHYNALLQSRLKLERCKPQKAARHPTIINDVKYFRQYIAGDTVANIWCYPI